MFLVVALSSRDGTGAAPATLFAVIGWGDYADGIAARVTRQYSRLGALMDPITDRLLVISRRGGVLALSSCCRAGRWRCSRRASWRCSRSDATGRRAGWSCASTGRGGSAVGPVMGSFFFAMVGLQTVGEVLLYIGLALALMATVLYARSGRQLQRATARPSPSR